MENFNFSAFFGSSVYKGVAVVSLALVGVYASKKIVDKFCVANVSVNAKGKNKTGSK